MCSRSGFQWKTILHPCIAVIGAVLIFVAESLSLNGPRGYTAEIRIFFPLIIVAGNAILLSILALPACLWKGRHWTRWFHVLAWLLFLAGAWRFGVVAVDRFVIMPQVQLLIDDGTIRDPRK